MLFFVVFNKQDNFWQKQAFVLITVLRQNLQGYLRPLLITRLEIASIIKTLLVSQRKYVAEKIMNKNSNKFYSFVSRLWKQSRIIIKTLANNIINLIENRKLLFFVNLSGRVECLKAMLFVLSWKKLLSICFNNFYSFRESSVQFYTFTDILSSEYRENISAAFAGRWTLVRDNFILYSQKSPLNHIIAYNVLRTF